MQPPDCALGREHVLLGRVSRHLYVGTDGTLNWQAASLELRPGELPVAHLLVVDRYSGRLHGELHEAGGLHVEPPAAILRAWSAKSMPGLLAGAPERLQVHPHLTEDDGTWVDIEVITAELDVRRRRYTLPSAFADDEVTRWEKAVRDFVYWAETLQGGPLLLGQAQKLCPSVSLALSAHAPRLYDMPAERRQLDVSRQAPDAWSAGFADALAPSWRSGPWKAYFGSQPPRPIDWRITPSPYQDRDAELLVA